MIGTARKNENSVATWRDSPKSIPPMIVAPERDVPGMSAKHCARPTFRASPHVIASTLVTRGAPWRLYQRSRQEGHEQVHGEALLHGVACDACESAGEAGAVLPAYGEDGAQLDHDV